MCFLRTELTTQHGTLQVLAEYCLVIVMLSLLSREFVYDAPQQLCTTKSKQRL